MCNPNNRIRILLSRTGFIPVVIALFDNFLCKPLYIYVLHNKNYIRQKNTPVLDEYWGILWYFKDFTRQIIKSFSLINKTKNCKDNAVKTKNS